MIAANGQKYVSSYAALNGSIIASSCSGVRVRPWGHNSEYPPLATSGPPEGFYVQLDVGSGQVLEANVTGKLLTVPAVLYRRWVGSLTGGIRGSTVYQGVALYEQFAISAGI